MEWTQKNHLLTLYLTQQLGLAGRLKEEMLKLLSFQQDLSNFLGDSDTER